MKFEQAKIESSLKESKMDEVLSMILALKETAREAEKILRDFEKREPKIREVLATPQSPSKHTEGPRVEDHYRTILSAVLLLRDGRLSYERAKDMVKIENYEKEWGEVESVVREHPNLLIAFAFLHDIAKPETMGFRAGDGSPAIAIGFPDKAADKEKEAQKREAEKAGGAAWETFKEKQRNIRAELLQKYNEILGIFEKENPHLTGRDLEVAFFKKYAISISYRGHAEAAYTGENLNVIARMTQQLKLAEEEKTLLKFAIEQHISPLMKFTRANPEDYEFFVGKVRETGLNPTKALRVLQSGMLVDCILGTLQVPENEDGTFHFDAPFFSAEPLTNFWEAERRFPALVKERARIVEQRLKEKTENERMKNVLIAYDLDGTSLVTLGLAQEEGFKDIQKKILSALQNSDPAMEEGRFDEIQDEKIRVMIQQRIATCRKEYFGA